MSETAQTLHIDRLDVEVPRADKPYAPVVNEEPFAASYALFRGLVGWLAGE